MPAAIPLVAAYASVSIGVGIGASTVIGGMMIAGGVMTAVGTLAGDKKVAQFGGLLSLAGGVANMAGWGATAEQVAGNANVSPDKFANPAATAESVAGATAPANTGGAEGAAAGAAPGAPAGPAPAPGTTAAAEATAPKSSLIPGAETDPLQLTPKFSNPAGTPTTAAAPAVQAPSAIDRGMEWAKANPRLVQAGTGMLSSVANYYGQQDAIKEQLRLQEEARQRSRDRMNASVTGLRMPTIPQPARG